MPLATEIVDALKSKLNSSGIDAALQSLAQQLRADRKYHELFEVLKMQARYRHHLPLVSFPDDPPVGPTIRDQLDDQLLENCREVGTLLLQEGKLQEGWMYLRPIGDSSIASELLNQVEATDENIDALIQILISEGVDPARGFQLLLDRYGTCNAITTFESEIPRAAPATQRAAASKLLDHLYGELLENVRFDLQRRELKFDEDASLKQLVEAHPSIFENHAYHIDATHLASVVRFAKLLSDRPSLERAVELCDYGCSLSEQYQFDSDEPFADAYPDHRRFFLALLGQDVDATIAYFRAKADAIDPHTQGTMAAEVLVDLLARVGRLDEALDESLQRLAGRQTMGIAPSLVELCRDGASYEKLLAFCQDQGDLLGYSTGLMLAHDRNSSRVQ